MGELIEGVSGVEIVKTLGISKYKLYDSLQTVKVRLGQPEVYKAVMPDMVLMKSLRDSGLSYGKVGKSLRMPANQVFYYLKHYSPESNR